MYKARMLILLLGVALASCAADGERSTPKTVHQDPPQGIHRAMAIITPTKNSNVYGRVHFTETPEGTKVVADVTGLIPGKHGFHIHEHGDCSAQDGSSAGEHFNPQQTAHGGPDDQIRHVGDLGNLEADERGHAHYERIDKVISLNGPQSIIGRSIVVHSAADDFKSQPSGNAGKKIGCGIILTRAD